MAAQMTPQRMKILIAAKIIERRGQRITSLSIAELLGAKRHTVSDKLKVMQPDFFYYGIPTAHQSRGKSLVYQINSNGNQLLREHVLTEAA
tara:strand:- start:3423 stop:3695 length:273 start_codon:yes stop_codon:yes gene_type:complete